MCMAWCAGEDLISIGVIDLFCMFIESAIMLSGVMTKSSSFPQENGDIAPIEVYHVFVVETYLTSEVLSNHALPGGVELVVEVLLQFSGEFQLNHLAFLFIIYEFNGLQFHVFAHVVLFDSYFVFAHCLI